MKIFISRVNCISGMSKEVGKHTFKDSMRTDGHKLTSHTTTATIKTLKLLSIQCRKITEINSIIS